jgi:hypothetical protein
MVGFLRLKRSAMVLGWWLAPEPGLKLGRLGWVRRSGTNCLRGLAVLLCAVASGSGR